MQKDKGFKNANLSKQHYPSQPTGPGPRVIRRNTSACYKGVLLRDIQLGVLSWQLQLKHYSIGKKTLQFPSCPNKSKMGIVSWFYALGEIGSLA